MHNLLNNLCAQKNGAVSVVNKKCTAQQLDGALPPTSIFTVMYGGFSIVFFNSSGSDVLQKETTDFSLGHPIHRI
jgi:hypothetical protein